MANTGLAKEYECEHHKSREEQQQSRSERPDGAVHHR
jgi:hypothetical protein